MPFDATLVLHKNNAKGCLALPHLQLPLAVFKRIQTVKIFVGRPQTPTRLKHFVLN